MSSKILWNILKNIGNDISRTSNFRLRCSSRPTPTPTLPLPSLRLGLLSLTCSYFTGYRILSNFNLLIVICFIAFIALTHHWNVCPFRKMPFFRSNIWFQVISAQSVWMYMADNHIFLVKETIIEPTFLKGLMWLNWVLNHINEK